MIRSLSAAALVAVIAAAPAFAKDYTITAYTGSVGGLYMEPTTVWVKLWEANIPGLKVTPVLGGGTTNPIHVSKANPNEAIGITDTIQSVDAWEGTGDFAKRAPGGLKDLRAIYRFNVLSYLEINVRGDKLPAGVETLGQVFKQKIPLKWTFMQRGNFGEVTSRRFLKEYGVSYDDLKAWGGAFSFNAHQEIGTLMIDGHADATMQILRVPAAHMLDMDVSIKNMKWLKLDPEVLDAMVTKYRGYVRAKHPVGAYKSLAESFDTIAGDHVIFVHKDMDEDLVYKIVKVTLQNPDTIRNAVSALKTFDPKVVCKDLGAFPLHPGAEKACKEVGGL